MFNQYKITTAAEPEADARPGGLGYVREIGKMVAFRVSNVLGYAGRVQREFK